MPSPVAATAGCRCRHGGGRAWTAQLRLLFETTVHGKPCKLALVRWYDDLPDTQLRQLEKLGMSVLRWAITTRDDKLCKHYDVIDAAHIVGPVLLQLNPLRRRTAFSPQPLRTARGFGRVRLQTAVRRVAGGPNHGHETQDP